MDCVSWRAVPVQCCKDILQTAPSSPSVLCLANLFIFVVLLFAYLWELTDGGKTGLCNSTKQTPRCLLVGVL